MKGRTGSCSRATSCCMRPSRIMKLVAAVSSSTSRHRVPASRASTIAAACDVEPEAWPGAEKGVVVLEGQVADEGAQVDAGGAAAVLGAHGHRRRGR